MQEDSLMNRALLKQDAKDAMKAANPHPVLTTLVFWAIQLAAQIILGIVSRLYYLLFCSHQLRHV